MHHCLTIQEILSNIFILLYEEWPTSFLDAWAYPGEELQTLARLARTCKAFHDPAINILWYYQLSLCPLIKCLPSDTHRIDSEGGRLRLVRDLLPTDWKRFQHYAHRIRVLGPGARVLRNEEIFASQVMPVIWSRRPKSDLALLSGVREFSINIESFAGLALYPRLIVGPALQTVDISILLDEVVRVLPFANVLSVLSMSAPAIKVFSCRAIDEQDGEIDLPASADLMRLIRCFENIESLNLRPIPVTDNTFAHLATLPKLRKLIIRNDDSDISLFLANISSTMSCFQNLRELKMEAQSLDLCSKVIECRGLQRLESLSIGWANRHISWDLNSFFQTLHNHCSHSNLKSIFLFGSKFDLGWPDVSIMPVVTSRSLVPLFSFTNMVSFQMDLDNRFDLDDQTLKSISEAWPQLHRLQFCERSAGRSSKVTLQGLIPLVANCPELNDLCLLFDATVDLPALNELGDITPGRKLHYFDVCTSPLIAEDVPAVIEFLIILFPAIKDLYHGWGPIIHLGHDLLDGLTPVQKEIRRSWDKVITEMEPILTGPRGYFIKSF